jgi:hypothetical protein
LLNLSLAALLFLFLTNPACSQDIRQPEKWYLPDGGLITYAGGFGVLSAGIHLQPRKRIGLEITAGYTPPRYGNIWTINMLASTRIFRLQPLPEISTGISGGLFVNFNLGKNIYIVWPDRYAKNYYWWNSSIRYGPYLEGDVTWFPSGSKWEYSAFLHCNTNDLYIASYINNTDEMLLIDMVVFGAGIRVKRHKKP